MKLNDVFDRIYCVNLDEATERWKKCEEQFVKYDMKVKRISAIRPSQDEFPDIKMRGNAGMIRSEKIILNEAINEDLNSILILEDDFQFVDNFDILFDQMIRKVPSDWDLLYFGGNHIGGLISISENIARMKHSYATHTFAIKNTTYKDILTLFENERLPGDYLIATLMSYKRAYVFRPHLSFQRKGFSYIENKEVNYDFLK